MPKKYVILDDKLYERREFEDGVRWIELDRVEHATPVRSVVLRLFWTVVGSLF